MNQTKSPRETREEILDLVAAGKMTAEEAARILSRQAEKQPAIEPEPEVRLLSEEPAAPPIPSQPPPPPVGKKKQLFSWLRVQVSELDSGKSKVNIKAPISFLKLGLKLGHRFVPDKERDNLEMANEILSEMRDGMLVDVADNDKNERVQVYVE